MINAPVQSSVQHDMNFFLVSEDCLLAFFLEDLFWLSVLDQLNNWFLTASN